METVTLSKRRRAIWISVAVFAGLALATVLSGPYWIPYVSAGSPRNQFVDSRLVEQRIVMGMSKQQVAAALGLPEDTMATCARPIEGGGTEVEIAGSSPPWRSLRSGCHTIVLEFDRCGRVTRGRGTWWEWPEWNGDTDVLQLQSRSD